MLLSRMSNFWSTPSSSMSCTSKSNKSSTSKSKYVLQVLGTCHVREMIESYSVAYNPLQSALNDFFICILYIKYNAAPLV